MGIGANVKKYHDFKEYIVPAMIYGCERVNNGGFYFYNVKEKQADNVTIEGESLIL